MFTIKTKISTYESFADFSAGFELSEKDLVITQSFLYEQYMRVLKLPCHFVVQDKYGLGEPSDEMINQVLYDLRDVTFDRVIGIGGGTVIDISKLFVLEGVTDVTAAFERRIPIVKGRTLVLVPTTCGTGSEVTNISIAEIKSKHTKMGLADNALLADHAVLIPELLKGLPFKSYVFSAIDALIHAIESYLSPKATPHTLLFSERAIETILTVFKEIVECGESCRMDYLEEMLTASNFAGIAFGNAGVGAVHALSYPLGGKYHVPHGEANYQFLTEVLKLYFAKNPYGRIRDLNEILSAQLQINRELLRGNPRIVYYKLDELLSELTPKKKLHHYGMRPREINDFTSTVLNTQQRLLANNYVHFDEQDIKYIYKSLF